MRTKRASSLSNRVMTKQTVNLEDNLDRWRYLCPRGHASWEPTNHHFWCSTCARTFNIDGVFYELHDRKTHTQLKRDEVRLMYASGEYESK